MKLTKAFIEDIRKLILSARSTVARGVDLVQVYTNYEIGRRINRSSMGKIGPHTAKRSSKSLLHSSLMNLVEVFPFPTSSP
jgi:hypothetical protein